MKTCKFCLDAIPDREFDGFTFEEYWNGFACPYFDFERAQFIVNAWKEQGWEAWYDQESDCFVFSSGHNLQTGKPLEYQTFLPLHKAGHKLYPVGTHQWTWDENGSAV